VAKDIRFKPSMLSVKEDVKAGVDFARERNVRLIVKGTGHDYLGRQVSTLSLA